MMGFAILGGRVFGPSQVRNVKFQVEIWICEICKYICSHQCVMNIMHFSSSTQMFPKSIVIHEFQVAGIFTS